MRKIRYPFAIAIMVVIAFFACRQETPMTSKNAIDYGTTQAALPNAGAQAVATENPLGSLTPQAFFTKGENLMKKAAHFGPDDPTGEMANYYQDAIDVFQELTRQYPKSQLAAFALFRMAECYHHGYGPAGEPLLQKGIPQAINIYQNLVQQYPNSEVASISQILTGILYSQIGKHLEAVDEYNKAFKLFPNILPSPQFTHLLPYTSSLGDVGISPIGALALYLIGEHYEKTGHTKEALEVFAQIVANYLPNYPNSTIALTAAYHQIEILWKTQQLKKMVAISEDLIRDCPKEGVIFFGTWHEGVTVRICDMEGVPRSLFDAYNKLGMHEKAKQLQEQYPGM